MEYALGIIGAVVFVVLFRVFLRRLSEGDPGENLRSKSLVTHLSHVLNHEPDAECEQCQRGDELDDSEEEDEEEEEEDATQRLEQAEEEAAETGFVQLALDTVGNPPNKRRWLYVMTIEEATEFGLPDEDINTDIVTERCYFVTDIRGGYKPMRREDALRLLEKADVYQ